MNQTEMDSSTYPVVYYDMFWYNTLNQSETHAYSLHTQYTTVIPILLGVAQRSRSLEDNFTACTLRGACITVHYMHEYMSMIHQITTKTRSFRTRIVYHVPGREVCWI